MLLGDGIYIKDQQNAEVLIIEIFLCLLNQFFLQKSFPECPLCAGPLSHKGKTLHYEVGVIGTDKVTESHNYLKASC